MHQLKSLFNPIKLGSMELKNRIVMAAMGLGYCQDGRITERMKNFYAERAKGGAGLIICNISGFPQPGGKVRGIAVHRDDYIPGLRELAGTVHAGGAKIAAQLAARSIWSKNESVPPELVGPSDFAPGRGGGPGPKRRPLTIEEIEQIVEEKGGEARRVREAGFDAIQIHSNVGTCLSSYFISPLTNRRTDRYGGSLENRYRFLLEILNSMQKRVGKDYPIMCRISGADFLEGGNTLENSKMAAPMLEKAGFCALDVTTGWHEAPIAVFQISVPQGAFVYLAEEVKKVVSIPVLGGTKVTDPVFADRLIADGKVDLVYMGRPLIADPELPNKAREGRLDEIRTCFTCGYCFDLQHTGETEDKGVACSINARAGREAEFSIQPAPKPKKVLIVGGGPAGMEAARVAALRGHHVTLLEEKDRLGGNLLIAVIPPFKQDVQHVIRYLSRQMELLGVEVKLNQEATPKFVELSKPDVVIVATGASAIVPDIAGVKGDNVATALDILTGAREAGERVVIVGGGMIGCETAEFLAEKGKKVTILEMLDRIGNDIGASYRWVVMQRLRKAGIRMETGMKAAEITGKGVRATRDSSSHFFEGDTVVLAVGLKSNNELFHQLQGKVASLYSIGDCLEPHRVAEAIESGFRAARQI